MFQIFTEYPSRLWAHSVKKKTAQSAKYIPQSSLKQYIHVYPASYHEHASNFCFSFLSSVMITVMTKITWDEEDLSGLQVIVCHQETKL